jgi:hypothetical protein
MRAGGQPSDLSGIQLSSVGATCCYQPYIMNSGSCQASHTAGACLVVAVCVLIAWCGFPSTMVPAYRSQMYKYFTARYLLLLSADCIRSQSVKLQLLSQSNSSGCKACGSMRHTASPLVLVHHLTTSRQLMDTNAPGPCVCCAAAAGRAAHAHAGRHSHGPEQVSSRAAQPVSPAALQQLPTCVIIGVESAVALALHAFKHVATASLQHVLT